MGRPQLQSRMALYAQSLASRKKVFPVVASAGVTYRGEGTGTWAAGFGWRPGLARAAGPLRARKRAGHGTCSRPSMTGGRRPVEYYDGWDPRPAGVFEISREAELTVAALESVKRAMRFRRKANRALRRLGVSFAQWRALEATWRLIRRTDDAVSQLDVSRELDLDESSLSRLMRALSERGLVDHRPDAWFFAYRVLVSAKGEQLLLAAYPLVLAAAGG